MGNNIVLIHAGIAVLFVLYLLVRIVISAFGLRDSEYQDIMKRKFRIPDYCLLSILLITGLYPIIILGKIELYHLLKVVALILILWSSRISKMNYVVSSLLGMVLLFTASYTSLKDAPKFPRQKGAFENFYPEVINRSSLEKGQVIFNTICAECHGTDGKKGLFQAADLSVSTLTSEQKLEIISDGSPLTVMQSFSNVLSESEIEAVVEYIEKEIVRE